MEDAFSGVSTTPKYEFEHVKQPATELVFGHIKSGGDIVVNSEGFVSVTKAITWESIQNKPATYPPSAHTHNYIENVIHGNTLTGNGNSLSPLHLNIIKDTFCLKKEDWVNGVNEVSFPVINVENIVIISPEEFLDSQLIADNGIFCVSLTSDFLIFECKTPPSLDINFNVIMINV